VHASLGCGFPVAFQEGVDLCYIRLSLFNILLLVSWSTLHHLMASLEVPDLMVLEPLGGDVVVVEVLDETAEVDVVVVVEDVEVPEDAGEVSNLLVFFLLQHLQLLGETIEQIEEPREIAGIRTLGHSVAIHLTLKSGLYRYTTLIGKVRQWRLLKASILGVHEVGVGQWAPVGVLDGFPVYLLQNFVYIALHSWLIVGTILTLELVVVLERIGTKHVLVVVVRVVVDVGSLLLLLLSHSVDHVGKPFFYLICPVNK